MTSSLFKATVLVAALAKASAQSASLASQTFFLPMPDQSLYDHTFYAINQYDRGSNVVSLIGIAVSTDGTRLYYDHWEDGFEPDATTPTKKTTQIWGDGDLTNGCPPKRPCTSPSDDVFKAGDVVILENDVPLNRGAKPTTMYYDGGDRVQASYPITVTRAAYPRGGAGSMMAGAIEVLDTTMYGTSFVAPIGENYATVSPIQTSPFEYVALYVLASQDNTVVTLPGGSTVTLAMGATTIVSNLQRGQTITANKPVLADLVTGDRGSTYELRWFSLLPTDMWDTNYLGPVGDSIAETRIVLYNPGSSSISVTAATLGGSKSYTVGAGSNAATDIVPSGSAISLTSTSKFIAFSIHDTTVSGAGQIYDWGYPLMATSWITSSLLVGLGYGCTGNVCPSGTIERNIVWVSPLEDGWVQVDYNNDGVIDNSTYCRALSGTIFRDPKDKDMSGTRFFGTKTNSLTGTPIKITGAWGQNAAFSGSGDASALDLGTVILPFKDIRVTKSVKIITDADMNSAISPGDTLEYTIQVQNVGPGLDIAAGGYTVLDNGLPAGVSYVPGTFKASDSSTGVMSTADDTSGGTPFPLDGTGFVSLAALLRRGGTHDYKFQVTVLDSATNPLVNTGVLKVTGLADIPFSVSSPLIPKTVWQAPPLPPVASGSCMKDVYTYYTRPGTLSCTTKQFSLDSITASSPAQCVIGKNVTLSLTGVLRLSGATKMDPHWFVARDGGDALTGKCAVGFFDKKYELATTLTESSTSKIEKGGCSWSGNTRTTVAPPVTDTDECGDVVLGDTAGGVMTYNVLVNTDVTCKDTNGDGKLDVSICFGWKDTSNDDVCTVTDKCNSAQVPKIYPGTSTSCFCASYSVPNVVVLDPGTKVFPCT